MYIKTENGWQRIVHVGLADNTPSANRLELGYIARTPSDRWCELAETCVFEQRALRRPYRRR